MAAPIPINANADDPKLDLSSHNPQEPQTVSEAQEGKPAPVVEPTLPHEAAGQSQSNIDGPTAMLGSSPQLARDDPMVENDEQARGGAGAGAETEEPHGAPAHLDQHAAAPASTTHDPEFLPDGSIAFSDADSSIGDEVASLTESLSSSVLEYQFENGRRYHAFREGQYHLPNDEKESDRLDYQHQICYLTLDGKLQRAPIPDTVQNVLDIGTGTGIWAIDFADAHPTARVIGTDLSPIQPSWVPPNLTFMVDDAESPEDWDFGHPFDYIHVRFLTLGMRNWPRFFSRCFNNLVPGGWFETMEFHFPFRCDDGTAGPDSSIIKWSQTVIDASSMVGVDTTAALRFPEMIREAGFVNLTVEKNTWPIGPWKKKSRKDREIGKWMIQNALLGIEAAGLALFTRVLRWSPEEIQVFLAKVRHEIRDPEIHTYLPLTIYYAQKPAETSTDNNNNPIT